MFFHITRRWTATDVGCELLKRFLELLITDTLVSGSRRKASSLECVIPRAKSIMIGISANIPMLGYI